VEAELVQAELQLAELELARQVALAAAVVSLAFPLWVQQAHLNAERQSHPFFFSKKIPCAADYNHTRVA
jgi:hypothetical protein